MRRYGGLSCGVRTARAVIIHERSYCGRARVGVGWVLFGLYQTMDLGTIRFRLSCYCTRYCTVPLRGRHRIGKILLDASCEKERAWYPRGMCGAHGRTVRKVGMYAMTSCFRI